MKCSYCGKKMRKDDAVCPHCGAGDYFQQLPVVNQASNFGYNYASYPMGYPQTMAENDKDMYMLPVRTKQKNRIAKWALRFSIYPLIGLFLVGILIILAYKWEAFGAAFDVWGLVFHIWMAPGEGVQELGRFGAMEGQSFAELKEIVSIIFTQLTLEFEGVTEIQTLKALFYVWGVVVPLLYLFLLLTSVGVILIIPFAIIGWKRSEKRNGTGKKHSIWALRLYWLMPLLIVLLFVLFYAAALLI